ncbi:MAG: hypothetical protein F2789_14785 [Actinobacteria bacterium]|nr:hypothetical protein [Actinomycetota bacterium]
MSAEIDRRRFLGLGVTGLAGASLLVLPGPRVLGSTRAAPAPASGPNLMFNGSFEHVAIGSAPPGWVLS